MSEEPRRVRLETRGRLIELAGYHPEATIGDLIQEIERYRLSQTRLITSACAGCGLCCHQRPPVFAQDMPDLSLAGGLLTGERAVLDYPDPPDLEARTRGIRELERDMGMSPEAATRTYEYNQAEPIVLRHGEDGMCVFLREGMCTIYPHRPLTCRLYICNMGERLSLLQERIATEGTWRAYESLGWTRGADLTHNAFHTADRQLDLKLAAFEPEGGDGDPEKLFFYY